jgi:prepilin-type N-terminal cleavage/methylation domain-containing protein
MNTLRNRHSDKGFTLVELMVSILVLGFILVSFAGLFLLFQRGSAQTKEYTEAQQNTRVALDFITDHLRQAGSHTDYFRGQNAIVYAEPYQLIMNADIDNGRVIDGNAPLAALDRASTPNKVTPAGATLYIPGEDYDSDAETILFTLDSSMDGIIAPNDRGDDPEEVDLNNRNLFVLKMFTYGFNGTIGSNVMRQSNLALIRGPNLAPTWVIPQPLFQYYLDHDDDPATANTLWGDSDGSGELETAEIVALTAVPAARLNQIRRVKVTALGESNVYDDRYETNGGFLSVEMTSEVAVRNVSMTSSMIRGMVFHDFDSDGEMDTNETGLVNVEVRLVGQNKSVKTDNFGRFFFPIAAGDYSIQEVDPPGYASTTPNLVSITVSAGQTKIVDFGDRSTHNIGVIMGKVYEDVDKDGVMSPTEEPIPNVLISLDDGSQTKTNQEGVYSFIAQEGIYTVVETDLQGFSSTTPNSAQALIAAENDTVVINFGDFKGDVYGTIEGHVFEDENEDGLFNGGEEGIPNATIRMSSGDSTMTNSSGFYSFSLAPGIYSVTETDPPGYTSTTVNTYVDIPVVVDTTIVRNFGDVVANTWDYVEIHISNTDRVLSVSTTDLVEDDIGDTDIVLGTALSAGIGNMLVFHNNWTSLTTPITELFDPDPVYRRDAGHNINIIKTRDLSGDNVPDVVIGLDVGISPNITLWFNSAGVLSGTPDFDYISSGLNEVMDVEMADFNLDGNVDMLVGLKSPIGGSGGFEIFLGSGGGNFTSTRYVTLAGASGEIVLPEVWAVEVADFDGDGDVDIVVGSHVTTKEGFIDFYRNVGYGSGVFEWYSRYLPGGGVNDLKAVDMMEDDGGDYDLLAAYAGTNDIGGVTLWLNDGSGVFGIPDTLGKTPYPPQTMPNFPDDYVEIEGDVQAIEVLKVNNDVFPDLAIGTRSSDYYTGDLWILPGYGTLPSVGIKINATNNGEIVTMDVADFNRDDRPDIVLGTRTSSTQGSLVAYFGKEL